MTKQGRLSNRQHAGDVRHLKEVLLSVRSVMQLAVRVRDPHRLLAEACNTLARTRNYSLAWIGQAETGSGRVVPVASAGGNTAYLDGVTVTWDESDTGRGPTGTAMRTRRPAICQDIRTDARLAPWRKSALANGFLSSASFPLIHGNRLFGALSVYAARQGMFDEEEVSILSELAADLAFALQAIEEEAERRKAEEALSLSEQSFRSVFEDSPIGIIMARPGDGKFLRVNRAFCRMLGFTGEELMSMTFADVTHPEHVKEDLDAVKKLWEGKIRHYKTEKRYLKKNGEIFWGAVMVSLIHNADGKGLYSLAIIEDITERHRILEEIRNSERRFRTFFEISLDAIFLTAPDGSIFSANTAACQMLERTEEEIISCGPAGLVDFSDPRLQNLLAERSRTGKVRGEFTMFRRDGSPFPVEGASAVFKDVNDRLCTFTIVRDITRSKQAENALRESEKRYRLLFDEIPISIWVADYSAVKTYLDDLKKAGILSLENYFDSNPEELCRCRELIRVLDINMACVRLFEADSKPELIGNWAGTLTDQSLHVFKKGIVSVYGGQRHFRSEFAVRTLKGRPLTAFVAVAIVPGFEDSWSRVLLSMTDITLSKQAEVALRAGQERLHALTARIESLREDERSNISREIHDELGQTLTGIKMDLSWIEHDLDEFSTDRRVNPMIDRLMSATELVDSAIKSVQRISAELRPGILDQLGLSMAIQNEASRFEERTGISCQCNLPEDEPALHRKASTAFFRVFQEALTNVARHAQATLVVVELLTQADGCRLEIRDNGRGITAGDLSNPNSLGLLGMQERARMLGGNVTFAPRSPGSGGTVVKVWIPAFSEVEETA